MTENLLIFDRYTLIFFELALGLLTAVTIGIVVRFFRQPLILAYVLTGIIISLLGLSKFGAEETLPLFANLGVAFLLFLVGLELRLADFKSIGKTAILTGLGQLFFTFVIGFAIVKILNFSLIEAIYISIALTFSSTIIVVKLLSEKKDINSLYGKITIGILLLQDLAAIIALIFLSGFDPVTKALPGAVVLLTLIVKGATLFAGAYFLNRLLLPSLFRYVAQSPELLFITAVSWCFILASIAKVIGFSLEIGAFLAGLAIASSPFQPQISAKIRPLRDFFIVIFFIVLGTNIALESIGILILPALLLSLFVLIGNPLIVMVIMGMLGHRKRTAFLTSVTLAQISEFSLIMVAMGERVGHIGSPIVTMVAIIGVITITGSSYLIIFANSIYKYLSGYLDLFEKRHLKSEKTAGSLYQNHIIMVGCEQMGRDILSILVDKYLKKDQLVIVDFNPAIVNSLTAEGYNSVYGDISDHELLEDLNVTDAKLIISTVFDFEDNLTFIRYLKDRNYDGPIIVTAYWAADAIKLYEGGASYVVVPELVGGKHLARMIADFWQNLSDINISKDKYFKELIEVSKFLK